MRFLVLALCLLAGTSARAETIVQMKRADMDVAETHQIPVEKAVSYFRAHRKQADFANKLALTEIARDGLGMKAIFVTGSGPDDAALDALSLGVLAQQIDGLVARNPHWSKMVLPRVLGQIKKSYELLNQTFNYKLAPSLDAWPWFLYQLGEKEEAKAQLTKAFAAEKRRLMNSLQNTSLAEAESLAAALKTLSSNEESEAIDADLRQLKVHVSNLPQNQIMT